MVASVLPREGAWVGGLMSDGFAIQCRADQALTLSIDVSKFSDFRVTLATIATDSVVTGHHYRGTAYVTGLDPGTKYYWRVNLDNGVDAATVGTEATNTAGTIKTLATKSVPWKTAFLGCVPWNISVTDERARMNFVLWETILNRKFDHHFHQGDVYYSDTFASIPSWPPTDYAEGEFANPNDSGTPDVDATAPRYRTNFINTYTAMLGGGALSTGGGGSRATPYPNLMAEFKAKCPGYNMWDDHDRAFNDCSDRANATGDVLARWAIGRDTGHELYINLNKNLIDAESGRAFTQYSSEDCYYIIDIPPCRFVMLACRTFRDLNTLSDTVVNAKTMLGATQLQWFKDRVDDNPQKFLVVMPGVMLDGNHGWNKSAIDGWIGFNREYVEMMNYIWDNGDAARTVFLVGDTHELGAFKHMGLNDSKEPIYEILCGNTGWPSTAHGFVNGLKEGVTGIGAIMQGMFPAAMGFIDIEHVADTLKVSLVCAEPAIDRGQQAGVLWSRVFK